jgi:hypothetical protein
MKNRHLAQLDRQIRLRGEKVQLVKQSILLTKTRANIRGIVKTLGIAQLVGGLSQTSYVVVISPTHLRRAGWPGATAATIPTGITSTKDLTIPIINDAMIFRGAQKSISKVDAIYDGDECVRIELYCTG